MAYQADIKDHIRETRLVNERAAMVLFITVLLVAVVVGRLVYLQVLNHDHFTTLSHDNHVNIVPVPPTRGLIYDRHGVLLAQNVPTFSLEITPEQVKDMDATLKALGKIVHIDKDDLERFRANLQQNRPFESIPLRYHLSEQELARFAVNRHRFPGVDTEARLIRDYPFDSLAAHIVGYVGRINVQELQSVDPSNYRGTDHIGKTGVEKYYENLLHGNVGFEQVETNALGRKLRVLQRDPPVPGENLYLTIDAKLQETAQKSLGNNRGSVVALDPNNGAVLAMVSTPSFDPNQFVVGIDAASFEKLQKSRDKPLFNRSIRGQYPPGSTLKPFIGLAGLDYGTITTQSTTFCPGYYMLPGDTHRYRDWKRYGHGVMNLRSAITQSCDVYFYDLAQALGIDRIHDFLQEFGFGKRTGIDITGELPGLLPSRQWKRKNRHLPWYPGETLITGIGQGFTLITPLQLAVATAVIANRGVYVRPHLLYAIQKPGSKDLAIQAPTPQDHHAVAIANTSEWDTVISAMTNVVDSIHGTAHRISHGLDYKIAGKTGTAQVFGLRPYSEDGSETDSEPANPRLRDHALFIAFAPVKKPRIVVAVVLENGGHGSSASPIARTVIDQYLHKKPT
jgi:penicillin-binding protein 2